MQPPPGYSVPDGMVCKLCRSLNGLKQAPWAWFELFSFVVTVFSVHISPRVRTLLYIVQV